MKCKDIERLIIEISAEDLNKKELTLIEEHASRCKQCAKFRDDLEKMRMYLQRIAVPRLSDETERKTQLQCHSKIEDFQADTKTRRNARYWPIPLPIWAAFASLFVLTVILMLPLHNWLTSEEPLTFQTIMVLGLIIQNAVTLCFAPVVLRKYRLKHQDSKTIWAGKNAI